MFVTGCRAGFSPVIPLSEKVKAHEFRARSGDRETLYIAGELVDNNTEMVALASTPIMRGRIVDQQNNAHVVEVSARSGLIRVMQRIHIDGKKVAGENF